MSLQPGEIIGPDLSPNAQILGTQIADNTIQLRNLTDDTFRILSKGQLSVSSAGAPTNFSFVAHGLSFAPIVLGFLDGVTISGVTTSGSLPLPTYTNLTVDTVGHQVKFATYLQAFSDTTNIYALLFNATGSAVPAITVTYYLLQEAAS